ncbi:MULTISPECIES: DUF2267 domain-containing protein [unclassified Streptomyces]|uniref:DUF2267 domain-containing protein n=1 Tax=unclassified Streptomyces TaxID=2593676 RepID=UPI0004C0472E|nr:MULTISPECIES: DUF2267 domain-containing protein [unclassified Streptomyces]
MTTPTTLTTVPAQPAARPEPAPSAPAGTTAHRTWEQLIDAVRESGQYATAKEAERITRTVLSAFGGHVTGEERVALARSLPERAARLIAAQIPVTRPLTAAEFVDYVAARIEGATPATARWDVSSVLSVLPQVAGEEVVDRVLAGLPSGYALLFGRPQLLRAA